MSMLAGKLGIVFGVANKRSIAWAIAQAWHKAGAKLAFTYQGERLKDNVEELAGTFGSDTLLMPCDVTKDEDIARVFSEVGAKFELQRSYDLINWSLIVSQTHTSAVAEFLDVEAKNQSRRFYRTRTAQ